MGRACSSTTVHYEAVVNDVSENTGRLYIGSAMDPHVLMDPLVSAMQREGILGYIFVNESEATSSVRPAQRSTPGRSLGQLPGRP
jgi:acyl-CoA reductase-like NAD-dependent aldehyde dehydrogenase